MATKIPRYIIYVGDTAPLKFSINKTDGTGRENLGAVGVKLLLQEQGNTTNVFTGTNTNCVVTDTVNGECQFNWPSPLSIVGVYTGQIYLDYGANVVQHTDRFELEALAGLTPS